MIITKKNKFYAITPKKRRRKLVGWVDGHQFKKKIEFSKHYFKKARALGIDADLIPFLEKAGVRTIVLIDKESDRRYTTSFRRFMIYSWTHSFPGFDAQRFMSIDRWNVWEGNKIVQKAHLDKDEVEVDTHQPLIPFEVKVELSRKFKEIYGYERTGKADQI